MPSYWPSYLPRHLVKPDTTLWANLDIATRRFGERPAIHFLGRDITYEELRQSALALAGWLERRADFRPGDRVALFMQNCPQWLMAYYGALRAGGVVVPVNPMYKADELLHILDDADVRVVVCAPELLPVVQAATAGRPATHVVLADPAEGVPKPSELPIPPWMFGASAQEAQVARLTAWADIQQQTLQPSAEVARPDDLALLIYTSGSTGRPKGCMHSHRTIMHTTVGLATWHGHAPGTVFLGVAPMYQVAGLTVAVNCSVYVGGTVVPLPRWDRALAARLIERYHVHFASLAPTALIDMLSDPELDHVDLSSLKRLSFGGATMPDSVWQRIHDRLGLSFIEAYGMTEAAATTHINPIDHPRRQCAGLPFFDTRADVIHPDTLQPLPTGESGEIIVAGPQLFAGYWQQPEATAEAFLELDGVHYFRTGDIGHRDEDGYYYITDRLKRMINASGFKVWPAEVENLLYAHPDIQEVCVIGAKDPYRGETVKAIVVPRPERKATIREAEIIEWAKSRMAAYKYPRQIAFVEQLPKSPVGKILWRELQDAQNASAGEA